MVINTLRGHICFVHSHLSTENHGFSQRTAERETLSEVSGGFLFSGQMDDVPVRIRKSSPPGSPA